MGDLRQFSAEAASPGNWSMNRIKQSKQPKVRLTPAGRALRRAALVARKTARLHGTPLYYWRNGKVVVVKP